MKSNREVFRTAVYHKMMNKALCIVAEESFFSALPYSFNELEKSDKLGLHEYVSSAIEQMGGAKNILSDAIIRVSNDAPKYGFLKNLQAYCHNMAMEAAERIAQDVPDDSAFSEALKEANFNEDEYRKFEREADSLGIEEIGEIISKKVVATIKGEQEAFQTEQDLDQKITDLVTEQTDEDSETYEEDVEKGVESFYKTALDNKHPRHYVSLFSKLVNAATESIVTLYPNEEGVNIKALNDVTFLFGLNEYRREMDALEALDRLVNVDATLINQNEFMSSAQEALSDPEVAKKGFVVGATAYTFMETMRTLNLVSPSPRNIEQFINTTPDPASYGNCAVESFVSKCDNIFKDFYQNIRTIKDPNVLQDYGKYFDGIREKLEGIGVASESFVSCREAVYKKLRDARATINRQYENLVPGQESVLNTQEKVIRATDAAALGRAIKYNRSKPGTESFRLVYDDVSNSQLVAFEALNNANVPIASTTIFIEGMESPSLDTMKQYIRTLYNGLDSKLKEKSFVFKAKSGSYEKF